MTAVDYDNFFVLLSLLGVLAVLYGLVSLTVYHNKSIATWDEPLGSWLVSHASPKANRLFSRITDLGSYKFVRFCTLLLSLVLILTGDWRRALIVIALFGASMLVMHFLKGMIPRERPDFPQNYLYGVEPSYPSGHTLLATAIYSFAGVLVFLYGHGTPVSWLGIIAFMALILLIGFSRVILGFHFLTDVIGGWIAGGILFVVVWMAGNYLLFNLGKF